MEALDNGLVLRRSSLFSRVHVPRGKLTPLDVRQFTTSFGIAIGIAVNKSFAPNSPAALISIGVLDALSAGVLLYGAMVELLYNDVRIELCLLFYLVQHTDSLVPHHST